MKIIFQIFVCGGAVALGIMSIIMTATNDRMYAGLGFAFLLLTAGAAPNVFKKAATAIISKVCTLKEGSEDDQKNQISIQKKAD